MKAVVLPGDMSVHIQELPDPVLSSVKSWCESARPPSAVAT